jgi:hypothetical protein
MAKTKQSTKRRSAEAQPAATSAGDLAKRLADHPMHTPSDLRYLRGKGYRDEQILGFWDRDHAEGKRPCRHRRLVTFTFEGIELQSAGEALQHANADPRYDTAILLNCRHYAVARTTAQHLAASGVQFAFLGEHEMPDGTWRIVTIPVND